MDFNNMLIMIDSGDEYKPMRPLLEIDNSQSSDLESFQNSTLRPILKMQNAAIVHVFRSHLVKNKIAFKELKTEKKKAFIHDLLKSNRSLKQFYIKSILALFTIHEHEFYAHHKMEINKRITTLLIERLSSQAEKISL